MPMPLGAKRHYHLYRNGRPQRHRNYLWSKAAILRACDLSISDRAAIYEVIHLPSSRVVASVQRRRHRLQVVLGRRSAP